MKRDLFILLLFIVFFVSAKAQPLQQIIRGEVVDAITLRPIENANVSVVQHSMGSATNQAGKFIIEKVPVGRHDLLITHIGYQNKLLPNVVVDAGKAVVLNIKLEEKVTTLDAIEIGPENDEKNIAQLEPVSSFTFSTEKSLRYPATFFDPGRLALSFAGVASNFDQSNHIVVRGNSPNGI